MEQHLNIFTMFQNVHSYLYQSNLYKGKHFGEHCGLKKGGFQESVVKGSCLPLTIVAT